MAICTRLIPAIGIDDIYDITVITDSITTARKILESKVNPFQNIFILLASTIKSFFNKDSRNKIHFWYCPSKAEWPRHKLVNDQVKANTCVPTFSSKDSHLFSKKKECDNILCKWQALFANSLKKGHYFLNFEDEKQRVLKPTYAKGDLWLPIIGFTNSLYARFTCMTTGHATCMTLPLNCAMSSLTASFTSLWITLEHLALIMVKVLSRHNSLE